MKCSCGKCRDLGQYNRCRGRISPDNTDKCITLTTESGRVKLCPGSNLILQSTGANVTTEVQGGDTYLSIQVSPDVSHTISADTIPPSSLTGPFSIGPQGLLVLGDGIVPVVYNSGGYTVLELRSTAITTLPIVATNNPQLLARAVPIPGGGQVSQGDTINFIGSGTNTITVTPQQNSVDIEVNGRPFQFFTSVSDGSNDLYGPFTITENNKFSLVPGNGVSITGAQNGGDVNFTIDAVTSSSDILLSVNGGPSTILSSGDLLDFISGNDINIGINDLGTTKQLSISSTVPSSDVSIAVDNNPPVTFSAGDLLRFISGNNVNLGLNNLGVTKEITINSVSPSSDFSLSVSGGPLTTFSAGDVLDFVPSGDTSISLADLGTTKQLTIQSSSPSSDVSLAVDSGPPVTFSAGDLLDFISGSGINLGLNDLGATKQLTVTSTATPTDISLAVNGGSPISLTDGNLLDFVAGSNITLGLTDLGATKELSLSASQLSLLLAAADNVLGPDKLPILSLTDGSTIRVAGTGTVVAEIIDQGTTKVIHLDSTLGTLFQTITSDSSGNPVLGPVNLQYQASVDYRDSTSITTDIQQSGNNIIVSNSLLPGFLSLSSITSGGFQISGPIALSPSDIIDFVVSNNLDITVQDFGGGHKRVIYDVVGTDFQIFGNTGGTITGPQQIDDNTQIYFRGNDNITCAVSDSGGDKYVDIGSVPYDITVEASTSPGGAPTSSVSTVNSANIQLVGLGLASTSVSNILGGYALVVDVPVNRKLFDLTDGSNTVSIDGNDTLTVQGSGIIVTVDEAVSGQPVLNLTSTATATTFEISSSTDVDSPDVTGPFTIANADKIKFVSTLSNAQFITTTSATPGVFGVQLVPKNRQILSAGIPGPLNVTFPTNDGNVLSGWIVNPVSGGIPLNGGLTGFVIPEDGIYKIKLQISISNSSLISLAIAVLRTYIIVRNNGSTIGGISIPTYKSLLDSIVLATYNGSWQDCFDLLAGDIIDVSSFSVGLALLSITIGFDCDIRDAIQLNIRRVD